MAIGKSVLKPSTERICFSFCKRSAAVKVSPALQAYELGVTSLVSNILADIQITEAPTSWSYLGVTSDRCRYWSRIETERKNVSGLNSKSSHNSSIHFTSFLLILVLILFFSRNQGLSWNFWSLACRFEKQAFSQIIFLTKTLSEMKSSSSDSLEELEDILSEVVLEEAIDTLGAIVARKIIIIREMGMLRIQLAWARNIQLLEQNISNGVSLQDQSFIN